MTQLYKPIYPAKDLKYSPTYKNTYIKAGNGFSVVGQLFGNMPQDPWLKEKYIKLRLKGHNGIDLPCLLNTPVFASHDGKVLSVSDKITSGYGVNIISDDGSFKTCYWHFSKNLVTAGQKVKALDMIGLGDSTGISTGNHLHFGKYPTQEPKDNGYDGAVDPLPEIIETPQLNFTSYLFIGKKGEEVKNLQLALANEGFLGQVGFAGFTGYFGLQTLDALKRFQLKYGIINSVYDVGAGFCGPKTRNKLNELYE